MKDELEKAFRALKDSTTSKEPEKLVTGEVGSAFVEGFARGKEQYLDEIEWLKKDLRKQTEANLRLLRRCADLEEALATLATRRKENDDNCDDQNANKEKSGGDFKSER